MKLSEKSTDMEKRDKKCSKSAVMCDEEVPYHIVLICYLNYVLLILFGYLRDFLRNCGIETNKSTIECNREVRIICSVFMFKY